jgi:hypothetical protein
MTVRQISFGKKGEGVGTGLCSRGKKVGSGLRQMGKWGWSEVGGG